MLCRLSFPPPAVARRSSEATASWPHATTSSAPVCVHVSSSAVSFGASSPSGEGSQRKKDKWLAPPASTRCSYVGSGQHATWRHGLPSSMVAEAAIPFVGGARAPEESATDLTSYECHANTKRTSLYFCPTQHRVQLGHETGPPAKLQMGEGGREARAMRHRRHPRSLSDLSGGARQAPAATLGRAGSSVGNPYEEERGDD